MARKQAWMQGQRLFATAASPFNRLFSRCTLLWAELINLHGLVIIPRAGVAWL